MSRFSLKKLFSVLPRGYTVVRVRRKRVGALGGSRKKYEANKEAARVLTHELLARFNTHYKFTYNKVAIRNQRSRWGSCSKKGNLNFNYRIVLLPLRLAEYVIVHELCHLSEFNHSQNFWSLVAETIPDHQVRRRELAVLARELIL
jgi:predicted metal-dependent hydrolase